MPAFADRLADAVRAKGPLCVGIDPRFEQLPKELRERFLPAGPAGIADAYRHFAEAVVEIVAPYCSCIKPQAAFYEALGWQGMKALGELFAYIQDRHGVLTILDAKRGDIASTATAYAQAAFGGGTVSGVSLPSWNADACTVNPYLGADAVEPFITAARAATPPRGLFVLARTSNPGGGLFQNLPTQNEPLYRKVAFEVAKWNAAGLGECGLGDVGAVVGATNPAELAELRALLPQVWFLVPGYGAQGGTAADVKAGYLPNGLGAIVNSSRGITFPFHPDDPNWKQAILHAAQKAQHELRP